MKFYVGGRWSGCLKNGNLKVLLFNHMKFIMIATALIGNGCGEQVIMV